MLLLAGLDNRWIMIIQTLAKKGVGVLEPEGC